MSIGDDQRKFTLLIAQLTIWVYEQGYEFTDGDSYRDPRVFGKMGVKWGYGHASSFHKKRLARDFNLFKNKVWLTGTEDHRFIGEHWKSMDPKCTWGGDFDDGNHYSYGESRNKG